PGPYAVRVEKPGYHAWEKNAAVTSRETTFLNDISLFRETAPVPFVETGTTSGETFSFDARYAAAMVTTRSGSELMIVDLRNGVERRPYRSSAEADDLRLSWSRDGRRLLVRRPPSPRLRGTSDSYLLWDASEP